MSLCPYRDIFGKPKTGFHEARLFGMARNDWIGTLIVILLIVLVFKTSFIKTAIITVIIAEVAHLLFCVDTPVTSFLKGLFT